jgi:hypothetical protein
MYIKAKTSFPSQHRTRGTFCSQLTQVRSSSALCNIDPEKDWQTLLVSERTRGTIIFVCDHACDYSACVIVPLVCLFFCLFVFFFVCLFFFCFANSGDQISREACLSPIDNNYILRQDVRADWQLVRRSHGHYLYTFWLCIAAEPLSGYQSNFMWHMSITNRKQSHA